MIMLPPAPNFARMRERLARERVTTEARTKARITDMTRYVKPLNERQTAQA
jgi:hypothetical protein